ncbi:hypothetical protein LUZ60_012817 [Juncus effusus]|nr:hypothetical protein LUZ60_012817 [Juncus effusus]
MAQPGFEMGTNTSVFFNYEKKQQYYEKPTSKLLSKCYRDFPIQQPLFIKPLLGHKFSDLKLHSPNYLIGNQISEGPDGFPVFLGRNNLQVTIPQLLSKSLSYLWDNVHSRRVKKHRCCIGIPIYFTDLQRRIVCDAAKQAGFVIPVLVHETTASAIAYRARNGFEFPENGSEKLNVVFVDIGVTSMQVCIAEYEENVICILSHSFDYSLGGRAFDEVLLNHFLDKFKEENGIDGTNDGDLYWQLYSACEKMKIELSSSDEASFEICWGDKNLIGSMKREEFERMCSSLLDQIEGPLEMALEDAGLNFDDIHLVENVGFASQIPVIIKKLTDFFGRRPNQVNPTEEKFIAFGCSLRSCFEIEDSFPYSIAMSWDKSKITIDGPSVIFPQGSSMNSTTEVSFSGSGTTFYIDLMYDNISDSRIPTRIERFEIRFISIKKNRKVQDKLVVKIDESGIIEIISPFSQRVTDVSVQENVGSSSKSQAWEELEDTSSEAESTDENDKELNEHEKYETEMSNISKQISEVFYDAEDE